MHGALRSLSHDSPASDPILLISCPRLYHIDSCNVQVCWEDEIAALPVCSANLVRGRGLANLHLVLSSDLISYNAAVIAPY